jgi:outer membrane protein
MKNTFTSLMFMATTLVAPWVLAQENQAPPDGWQFFLGVGALYGPTYLGDDDSQGFVIPNLRVTYDDKFFASVSEGIGYHLINRDGLKIGPILKYDFGRDEEGGNPFAVGDDTEDLIGLDDVDGTVELGGYIEYDLQPLTTKLEIRRGLSGHEGLIVDAKLHLTGRAFLYSQPVLYSVGPELTFTDGNYNDAYFGISAAEAERSALMAYDGDDSTVSYGLSANLVMPHTANVSTIFFANYKRLGDTITDSSLVTERGSQNQTNVGLVINYRF